MQKVKHWIFALSTISIGLAASTGFATWKITSNNKNSVDFTINADGDVTEGESSYIRINDIQKTPLLNEGFQGDGIDTPNIWNVSNSDPIGYPIVPTGIIKVNLTLSRPHDGLKLVFSSLRGSNSSVSDIYNLFRTLESVTSSEPDRTLKEQKRNPETATSSDNSGSNSVVFSVPDSWSNQTKTIEITYRFNLDNLKIEGVTTQAIRSFVFQYTNSSKISLLVGYAKEATE